MVFNHQVKHSLIHVEETGFSFYLFLLGNLEVTSQECVPACANLIPQIGELLLEYYFSRVLLELLNLWLYLN